MDTLLELAKLVGPPLIATIVTGFVSLQVAKRSDKTSKRQIDNGYLETATEKWKELYDSLDTRFSRLENSFAEMQKDSHLAAKGFNNVIVWYDDGMPDDFPGIDDHVRVFVRRHR